MRILFLLIIILISACQSGPKESEISQAVGQFIGECPQAEHDICMQIPIDPDKNSQVGEVYIIDSKNAKLQWQWEWEQDLRQKYEITVLYEGESWQPTEAVLIEQVRTLSEEVEIEPEIKVQYDPNLLANTPYVVQFGSNGQKLVIKEITGINEKNQSEKIVSETITTAPTDWLIMRGQLTETRLKGEVTRLVRDYLANYQAGNFADLSELAPEAANYNYQAELYITDFEVTLPESIQAPSTVKRAEISGQPIAEPFTLTAQVPVKINYSLFGIESSTDTQFPLTWTKQNQRWTMPFWGVTKAIALNQSMSLGENKVTLDGVATTHEATLVALTVSRNLPTTLSIEAYEQTDNLLYFKLPRAFKWIEQIPQPDQNELMVTIESVPAPPKTIKVDLSARSVPLATSGVQGRVEWGPTCNNPSTLDSDECVPYQAQLIITDPSGLVIASSTSDANGFYRLELPPGQYTLIPESNELMSAHPQPITVNAGELTYIPVIYEPMIP